MLLIGMLPVKDHTDIELSAAGSNNMNLQLKLTEELPLGIPQSQQTAHYTKNPKRMLYGLMLEEMEKRSFSRTMGNNPSELGDMSVLEAYYNQNITRGDGMKSRCIWDRQMMIHTYSESAYRGRQLFDWVYHQRGEDVMKATSIPMALREKIANDGWEVAHCPVVNKISSRDGTMKLLLQVEDDLIIEAVGIPSLKSKRKRLTICISSQVGCPMKCSFCSTGKGGFARNLRVGEILAQITTIEREFGEYATHVVFMGMGEPMSNFKAVTKACKLIRDGFGISAGKITISTVGLPNSIRKLAEEHLQATLAVSLHASNQALRESIVPMARQYPFEQLLGDCRYYYERTGKRITFEYTLLEEVNDKKINAEELSTNFKEAGIKIPHVNLISYNPVGGCEFRRPSNNRVYRFKQWLEDEGIVVTYRISRGLEANAACGQLQHKYRSNERPLSRSGSK